MADSKVDYRAAARAEFDSVAGPPSSKSTKSKKQKRSPKEQIMAKGKKGSKGKGKSKAAKKPASAPKKAPKRGPSKAQKAQAAKVSADAEKVEKAAEKVESDAKKKPAKRKASKKASKSGSKAKRKTGAKRKAAAKRPAPKRAAAAKKPAAKKASRKGKAKGKSKAKSEGKRKGKRKASKKSAAPRRVTTQAKSRTTTRKMKGGGRVRTTRKSSITKTWLKNPVNNWKNVAALSAATAAGYIATDMLDRFLATMSPKAEGDKKTFAWTYGAAVKRINARPDAIRMGAQFGLAAVAFGGAMWAQKKSEPAAYALIGLSLGAGVHLLSQVATKYLMPMIFKVDPAKLTERTIGARLYASEQDFVQTPMLEAIKAENEKPAGSPNQGDDGKGNLPSAAALSGPGYVGRPGTPVSRGLPTAQARTIAEPSARPRTGTVAGCAGCRSQQMDDAYDGPTATTIPGAGGPDPMPSVPEAVIAPDRVLDLPSASVAPDQVMTMPRATTAPRSVSGVEPAPAAPPRRRMSNEAFLLLGDPSANRDPFARRSN